MIALQLADTVVDEVIESVGRWNLEVFQAVGCVQLQRFQSSLPFNVLQLGHTFAVPQLSGVFGRERHSVLAEMHSLFRESASPERTLLLRGRWLGSVLGDNAIMTIVDAWIQHPTKRMANDDMFEPLRRWVGLTDKLDAEIPLEMTIAAMDEADVSVGLLSAWCGPSGYLISNDEVAACVQTFPTRFRGLASVDISDPVAAVRELRYRVTEQGFVGLRMLPWWWEVPPTDRRFYPVLAACVELGVPFCTQVGHAGPLRPSEPGRPMPYIDQIALDFPDLVIVGGHIGYPWTTEMIALATKYPNVYIDTSAYSSNRYPAELVDYLKGSGQRKVLFGSNYPMLTPKRAMGDISALGLSKAVEADFLSENSIRTFGLKLA